MNFIRTVTANRSAARQRLRALIGYSVAGVVGILLLLSGPGERAAGALLFLIGIAGATRETRQAVRDALERSRREALAAAREQIRQARRERIQRERLTQQEKRLRAAQAKQRATDANRAAREAERALRQQQEVARTLDATRQEQEAARIASLSNAQLQAELIGLFATAGFTLQADGKEQADGKKEEKQKQDGKDNKNEDRKEGDYRLTGHSPSEDAVIRLVSRDRMAEVADVQELEAWRRDAGASHAYLVSIAGFTPAAVRLTRQFPITLTEAYLLAGWKTQTSHPLR